MKKKLCLVLVMLILLPLLAYADEFTFSVTDVTVKNDDGTSRQEILAELLSKYGAYNEIPVEFRIPRGSSDIYILADKKIIGMVSSKDTKAVRSCISAGNTAVVKIGVSGDLYFASIKFHDVAQASKDKSSSSYNLLVVLLFPLLFFICSIVFSLLWCKRHPGPHLAIRRFWLCVLWAALCGVITNAFQAAGVMLGGLPTILIASACLLLCRVLDRWLDARALEKASQTPPVQDASPAAEIAAQVSSISAVSAALETSAQSPSMPATEAAPPCVNHPQWQRVPLVSSIAHDESTLAKQNIEDSIQVAANVPFDFVLRCNDSSMEPSLYNGDIVMIRKQSDVLDGQIAAVLIDNEATLKHVYHLPNHGGVQLVADNPSVFPTRFYMGPDAANITILGLAVAYQRTIL